MSDPCKNVFTNDEERFLDQYRMARAQEITERIRFKQKPLDGALLDYRGTLVELPSVPEQSYWKMFFAGNAPKLDEDEEKMLARIEKNLSDKTRVTPLDIHNLEQAYCKLSPFFEITEVQEARLKKFIRRTAEEDVAAGRFKTLALALRHYGLRGEAEEILHA